MTTVQSGFWRPPSSSSSGIRPRLVLKEVVVSKVATVSANVSLIERDTSVGTRTSLTGTVFRCSHRLLVAIMFVCEHSSQAYVLSGTRDGRSRRAFAEHLFPGMLQMVMKVHQVILSVASS